MRSWSRLSIPALFLAASWAIRAQGGPAPPGRVPGKTLEESVLVMQRSCLDELKRAAALEKSSEERKRILEALIEYMEKELEHHDALETARGVTLWLRCSLGRARALAGDDEGACREFDVLAREDRREYMGAARDFVDELRMQAFYLKAKTAFDAENYDLCIRTVDEMFTPLSGYACAFNDDRGNAAMVLKARALFLKKSPEYVRAAEECRRVIRMGQGNWRNNGRQLLYRVHAAMGESAPPRYVRDPTYLQDVGIGAYQLALREDDPAGGRELVEKAIRAFEATIAACRAEDVEFKVRLAHEPGAWFAMGICYAKLELWYESAVAFEGVKLYFSRERVGRLLAEHREFRRKWRRFHDEARATRPDVEDRELHVSFYREVKKEAWLEKLLDDHELRLRKSAKNASVACRRRWRESRHAFDLGLCDRARDLSLRTDQNAGRRVDPVRLEEDEDLVF